MALDVEDIQPDDKTLLIEQAVLGEQVQSFLASDVGRYMVARANIQKQDAMDELAVADPDDPKKIRSIQNKIKLADSILDWLNDAVVRGLQAIDVIDGRDE